MLIKKYLFIIIGILLITDVIGQVTIEKKFSSEEVYAGDKIDIEIIVSNTENRALEGVLVDVVPKLIGAEIVDAEAEEADESSMDLTKSFDVKINSNSQMKYRYSINVLNIPEPYINEKVYMGKAILTDQKGVEYYSDDAQVVLKSDKKLECNYNYICDSGENHDNCFQDCISGTNDKLCDGLQDGRCDPDCDSKNDIDCKKEISIVWYIAGGIIVLLLLVIIMLIRHSKSNLP